MWLFTVDGLISVTRSRLEPSKVQVRARSRETIERVADRVDQFMDGHPEVIETPEADYRYRIIIEPDEWKALAVKLADEVTYPNFKSEAARQHGHDAPYVKALHRIWETGTSLDDGGARKNDGPMMPVSIEYVILYERELFVRVTLEDGRVALFRLSGQKFLANGWKVAMADDFDSTDIPWSFYTIPGGNKYEARWVRDPLIVRIVEDARQASLAETWKEGPIPISRYVKEQK